MVEDWIIAYSYLICPWWVCYLALSAAAHIVDYTPSLCICLVLAASLLLSLYLLWSTKVLPNLVQLHSPSSYLTCSVRSVESFLCGTEPMLVYSAEGSFHQSSPYPGREYSIWLMSSVGPQSSIHSHSGVCVQCPSHSSLALIDGSVWTAYTNTWVGFILKIQITRSKRGLYGLSSQTGLS